MANNYSPATVSPFLDRGLFTDSDLEALSERGFTYCEAGDTTLYFYSEEGFFSDEVDPVEVFQSALRRSDDLEEIVIEGAMYCDKMRQGEFGGYAIRITKGNIQGGNTSDLVEFFRKGGKLYA